MVMYQPLIQDRLSGLKTGEAAAIVSIAATQAAAKRLADMGFVRGAVVEMIRPGRPCLVRIGATCVGLGIDHQRSIVVHST
jgi:Fe2+ transport system protein FeoA